MSGDARQGRQAAGGGRTPAEHVSRLAALDHSLSALGGPIERAERAAARGDSREEWRHPPCRSSTWCQWASARSTPASLARIRRTASGVACSASSRSPPRRVPAARGEQPTHSGTPDDRHTREGATTTPPDTHLTTTLRPAADERAFDGRTLRRQSRRVPTTLQPARSRRGTGLARNQVNLAVEELNLHFRCSYRVSG